MTELANNESYEEQRRSIAMEMIESVLERVEENCED
jgi:hypothetical protein